MNDIDRFEQFLASQKRRGKFAKRIDIVGYVLIIFALLWDPGLGDANLFIKLGFVAVASAIFVWSAWILRRLIDEKPPPISAPELGLEYDGEAPASEFREMVEKALKKAGRL